MTEDKVEVVKVVCPRCEGEMKKYMEKHPKGQGMTWVVCPECNGKGWIEAKLLEDTGKKGFFF